MEENMAKFSERLQELLAIAKKKKNVLEYQEINDFFRDMELDADQFDKILDFLEANNIDVLRLSLIHISKIWLQAIFHHNFLHIPDWPLPALYS